MDKKLSKTAATLGIAVQLFAASQNSFASLSADLLNNENGIHATALQYAHNVLDMDETEANAYADRITALPNGQSYFVSYVAAFQHARNDLYMDETEANVYADRIAALPK